MIFFNVNKRYRVAGEELRKLQDKEKVLSYIGIDASSVFGLEYDRRGVRA